MVEGIIMFFDEALPFRLLYSQELAQFKIVDSGLLLSPQKDRMEDANVKMEDSPSSPTPDKTKEEDQENADSASKQTDVEKATPEKEGSQEADKTGNEESGSNKKQKPKKNSKLPPSEIYGCEHLLRLCLKIPELLAEQQPTPSTDDESGMEALRQYEKESKQILAKVNDLIRFLHKHQSTMFADSYRKKNEAELRDEQRWMRRKRKRPAEEKQEAKADPPPSSNPSASGDAEMKEAGAVPPTTKLQKVN